MTIQRGIDPSAFALLSFGGSGPAQSPAVMELIGMRTCIVPPNPGNLSAFGLLAVDWRTDHIVTKVMHEDAIDLPVVAAGYAALEQDAVATLEQNGIALSKIALVPREADVRCAGPIRDVRAAARAGAIDAGFVADLVEAFHAAHLKTFGYNRSKPHKEGIELVNFCVSGFGMIDRPRIPELEARGRRTSRKAKAGRSTSTASSARRRCSSAPRSRAGAKLDGPAIVEEFGSTTVVFPGQHYVAA